VLLGILKDYSRSKCCLHRQKCSTKFHCRWQFEKTEKIPKEIAKLSNLMKASKYGFRFVDKNYKIPIS
jgi:hypothetical protein